MTTKNKELTQLVKSMKKNLLSGHAIDVPYSALKACYLQAHGEHPHAFGGKDKLLAELAEQKALVAQAPMFFEPENDFHGKKLAWLKKADLRQAPDKKDAPVNTLAPGLVEYTLHLADDEIGCLTRLSLDAQGRYMVPEDWTFAELSENAQVTRLFAQVPNVRKYGLPGYLSCPKEFFEQNLGLVVSDDHTGSYVDLHDDSGDSATITVAMHPSDWMRLMQAIVPDYPDLQEALCDWTELSGVALGEMPKEKQALCLDYLGFLAKAGFHAELVSVVFEWVYPDEDGGSLPALVNMETGSILIAENAFKLEELGVRDKSVRTRVVYDEDHDSAITPVYKVDASTGKGYFKLTRNSLMALNTLLLADD